MENTNETIEKKTEYTREQLFYARTVTNDILCMINRMIYDDQSLVTASKTLGLSCISTRRYLKSCINMRAEAAMQNPKLCKCTAEWFLTPEERLYQRILDIPDTEILKADFPKDLNERVEYILSHSGLDERELAILVMHYWEHHSKSDVAKVLGLTPERARQLCEKAVGQLRQQASVLQHGIPNPEGQSQMPDAPQDDEPFTGDFTGTERTKDMEREQTRKRIQKLLAGKFAEPLISAVTEIYLRAQKDSIRILGLSRRALLAMLRAKKASVLDVLILPEKKLRAISGVGTVVFNEILHAEADYIKKQPGLTLSDACEVQELLRLINDVITKDQPENN